MDVRVVWAVADLVPDGASRNRQLMARADQLSKIIDGNCGERVVRLA